MTCSTTSLKPIAYGIGVSTPVSATAETSAHPIRREYSGLPSTGYVRINQLARNAKRPDAPAPIPVSPVTIWRWVAAGSFPAPVKLSGKVTAWRAEDIRTWLDQQAGK